MMDVVLNEIRENGIRVLIESQEIFLNTTRGTIDISRLSREKNYEIQVLGQYFPAGRNISRLFSPEGAQIYDHNNPPLLMEITKEFRVIPVDPDPKPDPSPDEDPVGEGSSSANLGQIIPPIIGGLIVLGGVGYYIYLKKNQKQS